MKELNLDIFSKASKGDWIDLAKKQLKKDDLIEQLSWIPESNLKVDPYYDQSDIEGLKSQIDFFKNIKPFNWKLFEPVFVKNGIEANEEALEALQGGCDGITFHIKEQVDFGILLSGILVDICDICIHSSSAITNLPSSITGYVISQNLVTAITSINQNSQVEFILDILSRLSDEEYIIREASSDFFLEIASMRALRFLLFDYLKRKPQEIQIHTTVPLHHDPDQQWFLNSISGLASILGGSNSISFSTATGSSRTSRNVGNIIREESGISQYTDQCGGSYYVEALTQKIIQGCKNRLNT